MPQYCSQYRIGENITFKLRQHPLTALVAPESPLDGRIVAIFITEDKMFYDVLSTYYGRIYEQVDPRDIFSITPPDSFSSKTEQPTNPNPQTK